MDPHKRDGCQALCGKRVAEIYSFRFRSEFDQNPGGQPKVILRAASELRQQVVHLNQAPMNPTGQLRIDAAPERHGEGRAPETPNAVMRSAQQQVAEWRHPFRQ